MDDFSMLAKDFGFWPEGKSAPMKSISGDRRGRPASSSSTFVDEENDIFNDVFGDTPKYTNNISESTSSMSDFDYYLIFKDSVSANNNEAKTKSTTLNSPVYDKPLYEDNIFASMTTSPPKQSQQSDQFNDLLGNLGRTDTSEPTRHRSDKSPRGLGDLIPGFGSGSPTSSNSSTHTPTTHKMHLKPSMSMEGLDPTTFGWGEHIDTVGLQDWCSLSSKIGSCSYLK